MTRGWSEMQLGQFEVASTLLPCAEDGPFTAQLEIHLGQFEAVGGPLHGRQAGVRLRRVVLGQQIAPGRFAGPAHPPA